MAMTYRLNDYSRLSGQSIFVDTNVLIYLFWPTGQYSLESGYAEVFKNLLKQNNILYVDFLVISEFINRVLRNEYKKKQNSKKSFKEYRNSQDGKVLINDVYLIVQKYILRDFKIIGKCFTQTDIEKFLEDGNLDVIDKAIVSICLENNLVLLTNDKDFKNSGIPILTDNRHFFN